MLDKKNSKYLSLLLRHKPEKEGLILDKEGYTDVAILLAKLNMTMEELDFIVANNDKKRFAYNQDKTKIRASQGHSIKSITIKFKEFIPNSPLYHGTSKAFKASIEKKGLLAMNRQFVHLSQDIETAIKVGLRHAKNKNNLLIYEINISAMLKDKIKFFIAENNVVLCEIVLPKYLKEIAVKSRS